VRETLAEPGGIMGPKAESIAIIEYADADDAAR
jgi:hypothetical protein